MVDFVVVISNLKVWYEFLYVIMGVFILGGMVVVGMVVF